MPRNPTPTIRADRRRRILASAVVAAIGVSIATAPGSSADWPQWRGPGRDGVASDAKVPPVWPAALKTVWRAEVGEGHSCPVVVGARTVQFARRGDDEVLLCLDIATGKEVWKASYPAPYEMNQYAKSHGKGPKSTPVAARDRILALGISGVLSSFDASTGHVIWRREFAKEFPSTSPLYGAAASPLVDGDVCIVHVGGHDRGALRAFVLDSGDVRWSLGDDGPAYTSAIIATLGGERQVITQTQKRIVGVASSSGTLLWSIPFETPYEQNIITPVVLDDLLICSGLDQGIFAVRLEKDGGVLSPKEIWKTTDVSLYMSSPVLDGSRLFGFSHKRKGEIFCLDARKGDVIWRGPEKAGENAAIVSLRGSMACLTDDGNLTILSSTAPKLELLGRYRVSESPTWAHPVFVEGGVLIKDENTLALWRW